MFQIKGSIKLKNLKKSKFWRETAAYKEKTEDIFLIRNVRVVFHDFYFLFSTMVFFNDYDVG